MPIRTTKRTERTARPESDNRQSGLDAFREKRWVEAAAYLEKALHDRPDDAEALNALAMSHAGLGDAKRARSVLTEASRIAPDHAATYRNLAQLLAREGQALPAVDSACRAVELDPSDAEAVAFLKKARATLGSMNPASRKKSKRPRSIEATAGPSQSEIDSRMRRINSALARAAAASTPQGTASARAAVCLCIIARDEEAFLNDCLNSAKDVVDHIVLVDTGSTDRTVEIARTHNAEIHSHEWTDSFAEARNVALSHATGDWILVLDADERLDEKSKHVIIRAVNRADADAYEILIRNYRSEGPSAEVFSHRTCRLYRNRPEYRYRGRAHEAIVPSIEAADGKVARLDAVIHHYGYRPEMMDERGKNERYIRLLMADLNDDPGDVHCLYNLGAAHWSSGDYDKAVHYFDQAAKSMRPDDSYLQPVWLSLTNALVKTGRAELALAAASRAENMGIRHPQLSFCRANALLLLKRYQEAIDEFQSAIHVGRTGLWDGDAGAFGYKAEYGTASAYSALGDFRKAVEHGRRAVSEKPDDAEVHNLLGRAYSGLGQGDLAEKHFQQAIQLKSDYADPHAGLARLYGSRGRVAEALAHYVKALDVNPGYTDAYFEAARLLYSSGRFREAANTYQSGLTVRPDHAEGFVGLGDCYASLGAADAAGMAYQQALAIRPDCSEAADRLAEVRGHG